MVHRNVFLLALLLLVPAVSNAGHASTLQVDIVAENGRSYPVYAHEREHVGSTTFRAYLEASYGSNYAIRIRNNSHHRRGLVIAVDGRNIISGDKSNLLASERMYILEPWQSATYEGWRTSNQNINQFFFTDAENSYADAWQDHSAMGVIAVAVFNEKNYRYPRSQNISPRHGARMDAPAEMESSADSAEGNRVFKKESKQAGTGFGKQQYSYARVVSFNPESTASEKYFYKYEWRETLCQQHIIDCGSYRPNRFWPEHETDHGFAPYPPNW